MVQVIQIKRKFTGPGNPPVIAPGELAFNSTGNTLVIGDAANTALPLVSAVRQVEMTGDQPGITGTKTLAATGFLAMPLPANLKVNGGAAGNTLTTDGAGNLAWAPAVTASQQFVGSFDAAAGTITWTTGTGAGNALPAAAAGNAGWYLICDTAGATPPGGAPAGSYDQGDWLLSGGATPAWNHLDFGGTAVTNASDVGVSPAVGGASGTDVQTALENLEAAQADFVAGPAVAVVDSNFAAWDTVSGRLIKDSTHSFTSLQAAAKTYVDAANAAQDLAQDTRDDAQDVLIAANAAAILTKGDVTGPALVSADGNIAVYDLLTGKLIKDSLTTVASITAAIAAKADLTALDDYLPLVGGTVTGPIILPIAAPTTDPEAANKKYVDDGLASVAAGASVLVTAPHLTGNGLLGSEITFMGITIDPAAPGPGAAGPTFTGNGLVATPLALACVDGGTY
jgi:hypothetical protein